jgi:hypothetical protein
MTTPRGSDKINHGAIDAKLTSEINRTSSVRVRANSGPAAATIPSPRLEIAEAPRCRQKVLGSLWLSLSGTRKFAS